MSVLLLGIGPELAPVLIRRLLEEGDQVRAILPAGSDPAPFSGAHVATGDPGDDDLVERAAQGARSVVLGRGVDVPLEAAARGGVDRVILLDGDVASAPDGMSCVALVTSRRGFGRRRGPAPAAVAEAVNAADDLAGEPRLVADLTTDDGWRALGLDPP